MFCVMHANGLALGAVADLEVRNCQAAQMPNRSTALGGKEVGLPFRVSQKSFFIAATSISWTTLRFVGSVVDWSL
jgi:hypothetical protein